MHVTWVGIPTPRGVCVGDCMGLHGAAWCCVRLRGAAWGCVGLHGAAWGCMGLRGAAWDCMGLHGAAWTMTRGAESARDNVGSYDRSHIDGSHVDGSHVDGSHAVCAGEARATSGSFGFTCPSAAPMTTCTQTPEHRPYAPGEGCAVVVGCWWLELWRAVGGWSCAELWVVGALAGWRGRWHWLGGVTGGWVDGRMALSSYVELTPPFYYT